MSWRASKSGISRDFQSKLNSKYDPELACTCLKWARDVIVDSGDEIHFDLAGDQDSFHALLKNGTVLARLANALFPGTIAPHKLQQPPKLAFKQMELIELFVLKAKEFGVPDHETFQTVDLYERQNLHQVVLCLQSLARKTKPGYSGPPDYWPKKAAKHVREFTEEQMKAGQNVIGLQMGTNKGASQAGMNMGKSRMIID
ncbi:hypothetical protein CAPTEDRAFT_176110 [Capitella teleta]|uniref:Transgelin n=1 Tax=Capitella teleta TaxID=283909 RepID=R7TPU5_CAPTE|nr:hypothetical protein CAPTEDRAFT_176110 [Capitella teleta]|eukprot:ELT95893.1 hypothetical protein CAPTEDRAFT_176110 [Capitella teleta]